MNRTLRRVYQSVVLTALAGTCAATGSFAVRSRTQHAPPQPGIQYVAARRPFATVVVDFRATGERQALTTPNGAVHFTKSRSEQPLLLPDGSPSNETMYSYGITVVSPRGLPVLLVVRDIPVDSPDMVTVNLHDVIVHSDRPYGKPYGRLWLHGGTNTVRYEMTR